MISFSICYALTDTTLTDRIIIDGLSHDFNSDETLLLDSLGNLLESPSDSYWGEYNDIKQIKVTWDLTNIYIAVDACSWDNNVILFIDIYDDYGIEDMRELNSWQRSFKFYNLNPDFLLGTWDTNDIPQLWKVQEGTSQLESTPTYEDTYSTYNTGNINGSMEIKINWNDLFFKEDFPEFATLKLVAVITGKDDYTSGPDCAPDNLGGMSSDNSQMVVLDNYIEILIDKNGDGLPDMNIEPNNQIKFYMRPPFQSIPLLIENVIFPNGNILISSLDEEINFILNTNRISDFHVKIFDLNGKFISHAEKIEETTWKWNGRNQLEDLVPFGIYILNFISDSGELSHKEPVVVIK